MLLYWPDAMHNRIVQMTSPRLIKYSLLFPKRSLKKADQGSLADKSGHDHGVVNGHGHSGHTIALKDMPHPTESLIVSYQGAELK